MAYMDGLTRTTRAAAYGLVVQASRILLCRISAELPAFAGMWTLPGGGLHFGEDPAAAMVREVAEETGLHVRLGELAGVDSVLIRRSATDHIHSIRIIYRAEVLGGTLTDERAGSTDAAAWWTLDEARTLPLVDLATVGLSLASSAVS